MLFKSGGICPLCQSPSETWCKTYDWEYRSSQDVYTYLRCTVCGTLFINEVNRAALLDIYPSNYYSFSPKSGSLVFRLKDYWDSYFYQSLLKKMGGPTLSVLDVGGGTGQVLDVLKKADKRIIYTQIIDIDSRSKLIAEQKGHIYSESKIEDFQTDRKFDIILLLNIIEHLGDPFGAIEKAGKLLKEDGIIIIKTPNADSLDARLFRHSYWGGLHCPRHWIIFSDVSFKLMMKNSGLVMEKLKFTQGAPFWAWSVINLFRKKKISQHKKPLIEHFFFAPLSVLFAIFDLSRSFFSKTSQMFIILSK